jgi:hypothetical protein
MGKGKLTLPFSAKRLRISAPRQVALPTEAWREAEIRRRSAENGHIDLPRPFKHIVCL